MKRGLTIQEAADYCGITITCFRTWVRDGLIPGPWPGTKRYDKKAIDEALDKLSGFNQNGSPKSAYDQWKASQHDNQVKTYQNS